MSAIAPDAARARHGTGAWDGTWVRAWVRACVLAETVGMTAAASAAVVADRLGPAPGLAVVVAGGLVESAALAWFQSRVLARLFPCSSARRWAIATVLVAGVGWAAASAPAALSGDSSGDAPPLLLVLVMAAGLGLVMGLVLGAAQAVALRGGVADPWRWVGASAAGWTPAMAVVFAGATIPSEAWPVPAILATGPVTGVLAGAVLGLVTARFLPLLDQPPPAL